MDKVIIFCTFLLLAANLVGSWTYIKAFRKYFEYSWDDEFILLERIILGCAYLGGYFSIRIVRVFYPYPGLPAGYFQETLRWSYYASVILILVLALLVAWKLNLSSGGINSVTALATFLITKGGLV